MHATVNIGVVVLVNPADAVDHRLGFVRGCAVVEIDQRLAVYLLVQNRKVFTNARNVIARHVRWGFQACRTRGGMSWILWHGGLGSVNLVHNQSFRTLDCGRKDNSSS